MIFDAEVLQITLLSLKISALATSISLLIGLPLGTLLALGKFPGRSFFLSIVNTGMGLPPVVVGLMVAMLLWLAKDSASSAWHWVLAVLMNYVS